MSGSLFQDGDACCLEYRPRTEKCKPKLSTRTTVHDILTTRRSRALDHVHHCEVATPPRSRQMARNGIVERCSRGTTECLPSSRVEDFGLEKQPCAFTRVVAADWRPTSSRHPTTMKDIGRRGVAGYPTAYMQEITTTMARNGVNTGEIGSNTFSSGV